VPATHILKKTGSFEQASYAIQDTPEMVRQRYGRLLPQDSAAIAAQVLNRSGTPRANHGDVAAKRTCGPVVARSGFQLDSPPAL